ncbi:MAG: EMC6-like membrane protein [Halobacteriota archaeon]
MAKAKPKGATKANLKTVSQKTDKQANKKADHKPEKGKQVTHVEGIKKTVLASMLGIIGGLLSYYISGSFGIFILIVVFYSQRLILPRLQIDVKEYQLKDWFYTGFMTFAFWFVSWTILLNQPA